MPSSSRSSPRSPTSPTCPHVDDVFCALGTTIKKAGSQEAFSAIDHDAVVAVAEAAKQAGAQSFLHVTAMGANAARGSSTTG